MAALHLKAFYKLCDGTKEKFGLSDGIHLATAKINLYINHILDRCMTRKVSLIYELEYSGDLDHIVGMLTTHINARNSALEEYGENVTISNKRVYPEMFYVRVDMEEKTRGGLEGALRTYISLAGVPNYVNGGSDYGVVQGALEPLGKTLRRPIFGALTFHSGKNVVRKGSLRSLLNLT